MKTSKSVPKAISMENLISLTISSITPSATPPSTAPIIEPIPPRTSAAL